MPRTQILTPPTAEQEPVSLALLCVQAAVDLDLTATDPVSVATKELLGLKLSAAREKVEAYTGRYFAPQALKLTYRLDEPYDLPAGAVASAVEGFYTDLDALANAGAYLVEYGKGISVNRELGLWEAAQQTYTVTANIAAPPVPALAKEAILELAAEFWKNRESSITGTISPELSVNWKVKLQPLVLNPLGAY